MIITIDGPTASGKSTVAQTLANKLSYSYLNSGLLYRATAYILQQSGLSLNDMLTVTSKDIERYNGSHVCYTYTKQHGARVIFNDHDITPFLKNAFIDQAASILGSNKEVRYVLLDYQRSFAQRCNTVADGRDCGTIVFPNADYKFFLTASLEVRAYRWQQAQRAQGYCFSLQESKECIEERDSRDMTRLVAPLVIPKEAHSIDSSFLTVSEVVNMLVSIIQEK